MQWKNHVLQKTYPYMSEILVLFLPVQGDNENK